MSPTEKAESNLHPAKAIRCFDVFAEYTRLERRAKGYKAAESKGYGIWLAKVVAARKFGSKTKSSRGSGGKKKPGPEPKFREIGDELQTDKTFKHDIVDRMGNKFYKNVFAPAIAEANEKGKKYEDIRDSVRKSWKPKKQVTKK